MNSGLHTFIDIFSADFLIGEENVRLEKIVIPIIQRDYAQGRDDPEVERVRKRFLDSLKNAITEKAITLDFVYGDISTDGIMTPLDGQQRLTTLFLLHWYAAKKENVSAEESAFLNNFSYATRYSARDFCSLLTNEYKPSFEKVLSEELVDQAWFPLGWKNDPTISSMLVMLDSIHSVFKETENIWESLKNGAVSFYFLPIKDMGLTDELYIKMNSRGKPLTQFEHFKAELEHGLREIDDNIAKRIMRKIDIDWTDMLWQYRGEDNVTDDEFLRYFRFVCDIICYKSGGTTQGKSNDEFDLQKEYFSKDSENVIFNITMLESYFDCWCHLDGQRPEEVLSEFISDEHEAGKIIIERHSELSIFHDCLKNYADVISGNGNRSFPLNKIILLFAIVTYLQNKDTVAKKEFSRRLRIINNLIKNSEDEISDSEHRRSGNRMPAILRQVEKLVITGAIDLSIEKTFNTTQLEEEIDKEKWLNVHPMLSERLFKLEDHTLLQGQVGIVGLDNPILFDRFEALFRCDWDLVDRALMSVGFYAQKEKGWRHQIGTRSRRNINAWRRLFHKSNNTGFEKTKQVLSELLLSEQDFTDVILKKVIDKFIEDSQKKCEFTIRYYYVKYECFRPGSYEKYTWEDPVNKPYELAVMQTETKWSENTYQPFLKAIDENRLSRDYLGQCIILDDMYIECENDAYVIKNNDTDEELKRYVIKQNDQGVDVEDRILLFKQFYPSI